MADASDSVVFLVDDDRSTRVAIERLLQSANLSVESFDSARGFLERGPSDVPSCLVLDVQMPGVSGIQLQQMLRRSDKAGMPIVFITAFGDVSTTVQAMKSGAEDFLEKPFESEELFDAVGRALERDRTARAARTELAILRARLGSLTPRELEVLRWVVAGVTNKRIAGELGTAEKTIKKHRGRMMLKMKAQSLADLVRMADWLALTLPCDAEVPSHPQRAEPVTLDPPAVRRKSVG